jgi:hypothetical protein
MEKRPSLIQFCPLRHGPNGMMVSLLTKNSFLPVRGISIMVILFPMDIFSRHGEVSCGIVMLSQQSSSFANFPSAKFPLESSVIF